MSETPFSTRRGASIVPRPVLRAARTATVRLRHVGLDGRDFVLAAYPKSGSTWLRFVLATALTGEEVDFDSVRSVSPLIGEQRGTYGILPRGGRLVKTHYLPRFVGPAPRVLYLVRDGRDVAVSYHQHLVRRGLWDGDRDHFLDLFAEGRIGPWGRWQDHVTAWSDHLARSRRPSSMVRYEDLLGDPVPTLTRAFDALGHPLDPALVERALLLNTPDAMRAKESGSSWLSQHTADPARSFVGRGRAGTWREAYDAERATRFDESAAAALDLGGYSRAAAGPPIGVPGGARGA